MPMASSTQDLVPHFQLANTFGALFIGVILAAVLFGVTNTQAFIYFRTHSGAGMTFHKLVVIGLWILDALHLALIVHCIYYYLVINFANIDALRAIVWSSKLQSAVAALSIFVEHLLYVHHIRTVSKGRSKVLPITVGVAVVLNSGVAIVVIWCIYQKVYVITDFVKIAWALYMYLGTVAFVDILIASSLCYLLATSRTGFPKTDLFITRLMSYIINTGCLTRYFSFQPTPYLDSYFVQYVFNDSYHHMMPKNYIFEAIEFLLLKLYINSYIALLNAGYYVRANADRMYSSEFHTRRDVYRPKLHVEDGELQTSRKSMFQHPDDQVLHITRPIQAVMPQRPNEMTMEMNSLSSA
ncbi:hypothetical protein EDB19DRAFT_1916224 [Suillus lakei]|nr:hypothetical protein EDB19DRAFT_1916224 [Suillus lakei]